ncbi:hypothetical protein EG329_001614 [Mollisiaceae sp. DMI_Dod_QoI]|nr:hypothetical protein EG329_001614 [Helotiales sp. DMI_Dod_QoI]
MRLLNTSTLVVLEFLSSGLPQYAILSHRWERGEVSYQDLLTENVSSMQGYSKIKECCAQALSDGWKWVWIDTCCIDKSSSAELSEAINSMYNWYAAARTCYVYLSDVPAKLEGLHRYQYSAFRQSKWFTRGWTLQELLAPKHLVFFDQEWEEIGTKSSLQSLLSSITGINDFENYESVCIARKMSWAAARETTRMEDQAYSLMGIFGVHMPLLYGEGARAFLRLQLEILKISDDESIFAWSHHVDNSRGLLAASVSCFRHSQDVEKLVPSLGRGFQRRPYAMTNKGLHIVSCLIPPEKLPAADAVGVLRSSFVLPLNCMYGPSRRQVVICLSKWSPDQYFVSLRGRDVCQKDIAKYVENQGKGCQNVDVYVVQWQPSKQVQETTTFVTIKDSGLFGKEWTLPDNWAANNAHLWTTQEESSLMLRIDHSSLPGSVVALLYQEASTSTSAVDTFVVVLGYRNSLGLRLFVLRDSQEWAAMRERLRNERGAHDWNFHDRMSEKLPSGKSVSASIKPSAGPSVHTENNGTCRYMVNIMVDEVGLLRWPIPGVEQTPELPLDVSKIKKLNQR